MKLAIATGILCDTAAARKRYAAAASLDILHITHDSRRVARGGMFVAIAGMETDGHRYISDAVKAGAAVIVAERPVAVPRNVVLYVVDEVRRRLAALADAFYGEPTKYLHVTGVTGTNGKTTAAFRTRSIFEAAESPTGLIGSIWYQIGDRRIPARNTTPDSLHIQGLFDEMVGEGLSHAVVEVSSHALDLHRVGHTAFDVGVFTNLSSHEHLDYHVTFENYRNAKARLFDMLSDDAVAVINADDRHGPYMAEHCTCPVVWFGLRNRAHVSADVLSMDTAGTSYRLITPDGTAEVRSRLVGEYNVLNDLAAAATAYTAGVELDDIVAGLQTAEPVPGGLERIPADDFCAVVDYAHNEGAMNSVLGTLRPLATERLIIVFGAGGDRDATKCPAMAKAAQAYCDLIFLTADNSRNEETLDIIAAIEGGLDGSVPYYVIPDRELAIRAAVNAAQPGDLLVVAGKGHETYQILGPVTHDFDDRDVLRRAIAERRPSPPEVVRTEV